MKRASKRKTQRMTLLAASASQNIRNGVSQRQQRALLEVLLKMNARTCSMACVSYWSHQVNSQPSDPTIPVAPSAPIDLQVLKRKVAAEAGVAAVIAEFRGCSTSDATWPAQLPKGIALMLTEFNLEDLASLVATLAGCAAGAW